MTGRIGLLVVALMAGACSGQPATADVPPAQHFDECGLAMPSAARTAGTCGRDQGPTGNWMLDGPSRGDFYEDEWYAYVCIELTDRGYIEAEDFLDCLSIEHAEDASFKIGS